MHAFMTKCWRRTDSPWPVVSSTASQISLTCCQNREKKQTKIEQSGMTEEELIRAQEELFRNATNKFHSEPS